MPISNYLANKLISHCLRGNIANTQYTPPAAVYLALHSGDLQEPPSEVTEFSGGGYERQLASFSLPLDGATSTLTIATFSNLPTSLVGATHFGVWDAQTEGNLLWWGIRAAEAINTGDTLKWAASAVTLEFKLDL